MREHGPQLKSALPLRVIAAALRDADWRMLVDAGGLKWINPLFAGRVTQRFGWLGLHHRKWSKGCQLSFGVVKSQNKWLPRLRRFWLREGV